MKVRHTIVIGLALFVLVAGVLVSQSLARPYTFHGSLIEPPLPAKDFTLRDQHGNLFRLSEQRGYIVLLFFGYTNCPDVCPATLAQYRQIKNALEEKASQVRFVFVTVDPERDTAAQLRKHLERFDATFVGLSGTRQELEKVWQDYGVFVAQNDPENSSGGYLVDHTARTYVIDSKGYLRLTYPFGTQSEVMRQDILHLLRE